MYSTPPTTYVSFCPCTADVWQFIVAEHDISFVRDQMFDYFQVGSCKDMLTHMYSGFNKAKFAGFALRVVQGLPAASRGPTDAEQALLPATRSASTQCT